MDKVKLLVYMNTGNLITLITTKTVSEVVIEAFRNNIENKIAVEGRLNDIDGNESLLIVNIGDIIAIEVISVNKDF